MQLGMHNTLEEIAEAQERAQLIKLSTTRSGRHILKRIGIPITAIHNNHREIPSHLRKNITVISVPRNVHPIHNVGRRQARAKALLEKAKNQAEECSFVDATFMSNRRAFSAVLLNGKSEVVNQASTYTTQPDIAQQVAIALAHLGTKRYRGSILDIPPFSTKRDVNATITKWRW